jgi:hypothetical protein
MVSVTLFLCLRHRHVNGSGLRFQLSMLLAYASESSSASISLASDSFTFIIQPSVNAAEFTCTWARVTAAQKSPVRDRLVRWKPVHPGHFSARVCGDVPGR